MLTILYLEVPQWRKKGWKPWEHTVLSYGSCLNTATKEELMTLSGIGESKAEAIIKYREDNGTFKTIEEIKNVSGIGDAAFEKIKDSITV